MSKFYIIGNGFDLHHNLKTNYYDYKDFLVKLGYEEMVDAIDLKLDGIGCCPKDIEKWSLLERYIAQLNNLDADEILENAFFNSEDDMDRASYWHDPEYNAGMITQEYNSIVIFLKEHFKEWIDSVCINKSIKDNNVNLSKNDYYLTFNYTHTLEIVYDIPSTNILHIHTKDDNYIFGHNDEYSVPFNLNLFDENNYEFRSERVRESINNAYGEIYNCYYKNSSKLINENLDFILHSSLIDEVVFMGFSFGTEDMLYVDCILTNIDNDAHIIVYYHNNSDLLIAYSKLSKYNVKYIKW